MGRPVLCYDPMAHGCAVDARAVRRLQLLTAAWRGSRLYQHRHQGGLAAIVLHCIQSFCKRQCPCAWYSTVLCCAVLCHVMCLFLGGCVTSSQQLTGWHLRPLLLGGWLAFVLFLVYDDTTMYGLYLRSASAFVCPRGLFHRLLLFSLMRYLCCCCWCFTPPVWSLATLQPSTIIQLLRVLNLHLCLCVSSETCLILLLVWDHPFVWPICKPVCYLQVT